MIKKTLVGIITAVLTLALSLAAIGCKPPAAILSPPSWIQGTWSNGMLPPGNLSWTFTASDATYTQGAVTLDWGQLGGTSGTTISDSSTSTTYTLSVTQGGATINYTFVSLTATTLTFMGGFTLTKQ